MKAKAIATILALVFILTGFATVVPTTSASLPLNVTASNVTAGSFTITWSTTFNEQGRLDWQQGIAASPLGNTFTEAGASNLHSVLITGLAAGTPHSYTIWSEGVEYGDSDGDGDPATGFPLAGALPWTVITTSSATPGSGLVFGHVTNLATGNAVGVTVIITDPANNVYSGTTDANGNYLVNVYGYLGPADIEIEGAAQGMYPRTAIPGGITGNPHGPVDITLTLYTPGSLTMLPAAPSVTANGADTEIFTVTVTDLFGSPIDTLGGGDFTITWLQHYSADSTLVYTSNDGGGAYTFTYTSGLFAPGTDQPQITYAGVSDDSTIDVQLPLWYLHIDDQGGSELDLIIDTPSDDTGPNNVSLEIPDAGVDGMLGVWNTTTFTQNTDVGGTWWFSVDLYEDEDIIDGNIYAKIYSGGSLKRTTVNQSIGDVANTAPGDTISWSDTIPASTIISSGDNISVEYWFDATAGGSDSSGLTRINVTANPGSEVMVNGTGGGAQGNMGPVDGGGTNDIVEVAEGFGIDILWNDPDMDGASWDETNWNDIGARNPNPSGVDWFGQTLTNIPNPTYVIIMKDADDIDHTYQMETDEFIDMDGKFDRWIEFQYDLQDIDDSTERPEYYLYYNSAWQTPVPLTPAAYNDGDQASDTLADWETMHIDLETVVPAITDWTAIGIGFLAPQEMDDAAGVGQDEFIVDNVTFGCRGGASSNNRMDVRWSYDLVSHAGSAPTDLWVDASYTAGDDGPVQIQISETNVWGGEEWTVATIAAGGSVDASYSVGLNYTNPTYVRAYVPEGSGTDEQTLSIDRLFFETNSTGANSGQTLDMGWGSGGANPNEMNPGNDGVTNDIAEEPEGTGATIMNAIGEQTFLGTTGNDSTETYFVPDDGIYEDLVEAVYAAPADVIIDDAASSTANFKRIGSWSNWNGNGYNTAFQYCFSGASNYAEWYPNVTVPGNYSITGYGNSALGWAENADYEVTAYDVARRNIATPTAVSDLDQNGDGWTISLGTYYLSGDSREKVMVRGDNWGPGTACIADAMKFAYVDTGGASALDHNWTFDTTPVTTNAVTLHIDYSVPAGADDEYRVQYSSAGGPYFPGDVLGYLKAGETNNDRSFDMAAKNVQIDPDDEVYIRIFSNNSGDVQDTVHIDRIWLEWASGAPATKNRLNATWVYDLATIGGDPDINVTYDVDSWGAGDDNLQFQWSNDASTWNNFGSAITPASTDVSATVDLSGLGVVFDSTFYIRAYVAEATGTTTQTLELDQLYVEVSGGGGNPYKLNMGYDTTSGGGMDGWIIMPQCPGGTPPTVSSTTPGSGATDVVESTSIEVVFDMAMDNTVTPVLTQTAGTDPGGWSFSGWSVGDTTATWTHNDWLSEDSVTMEVSGAKSSGGVLLAAPYSWSFTIQDHIEPTIAATVPTGGAPDANEDQDVIVNFTEPMDTGTPPVLVQTGGPDPGGWSFAGWDDSDTARWTHNTWASEAAVTMQVSGAIDANGLGMVGPYVWSFTVRDRILPSVVSETPVDGSSSVAVGTNIVVVFDEPMNTGVTPTLVQTTGTPVVGWVFQGWSVGDTTASWIHDDWSGGELITMQISNAQDDSSNVMVLYEWDFTTIGGADVTPPDVFITSPANSAIDVVLGENIVITFNEAMNTSLEPTLTQTGGTDTGGWTFSGWDLGNTRATWTHNAWNPGDSITMEVVDFNDTSDNQQTTPYSWSFTTEYPDIQVMFHLETRWNMFSLNVFNTSDMIDASEISTWVSAAGGSAMVMSWWEPGVGYHSYTGSPGDDFELEVGIGYWIFLDEGSGPADIPLYGLDRPTYVAWDLAKGDIDPRGDGTADGKITVPLVAGEYNILGWFNDTAPAVAEFIDLIDDGFDMGARGFILYWDNPGRAYGMMAIQLIPGTATQGWPVEPMKGYWSGINTATSVTY